MSICNTSARILKCINNCTLSKVHFSNRVLKLKQGQTGVRSASRFSLTSDTPNIPLDKEISRLAQVNELYIEQKPVENVGSFDAKMTQCAYDIKDGKGENIYTCTHVHGPRDPFFDLKIFGSDGEPIIRKKLYQTVPSGLLHMQVYSAKGQLVGVVQEKIVENGGKRFFDIKNPADETVCLVSNSHSGRILSRHHKILSPDGHREIGKIFKKWSGMFSGDDLKVTIDVPQHLNPHMKVLLIGVPILLGQRFTK